MKELKSAFPYSFPDGQTDDYNVGYGMTLRDYFAAKAMIPCYQEWLNNGWNLQEHPEAVESIAYESYLIADAMMKAREQ